MSRNYSIESLREIASGDEDFMKIVALTFLEEIPPDLSSMEEAISNDNKELAYQFAHKMKPNLEMFGIDVMKDVASIESWTKSNKPSSSIDTNLERVTMIVGKVFN